MTASVRRSVLAGLKTAAVLVAGYLLALWTWPQDAPEYREVIVTRTQIEQSKPDTIIKWKERIVYRTVERETIAVAPGGAAETVNTFCESAGLPSVDTVTGASETARPAVVPMLFDAGTYDGRTLKLWEVRSNGDAAQETFKVRAPFRFAVKDGTALVQGQRFWWVDDVLKGAALVGAGYVAGRVIQ